MRRRFSTLDAARAWVAEVQAGSARTPAYAYPSQFTVRQLADKWLSKREK